MKKIYFIIVASLFGIASCDLDRLPETDFTDAGFWNSEKDIKGANNYLYRQTVGFIEYHDCRSDELVQTTANKISNGSRSVESDHEKEWTLYYQCIFAANNVIEKGATVPVEEEVRNRWLAESHFFRAYNYFLAVQNYGDVPLHLETFKTTDDPAIKRPRDPREKVIQQCYEDLEFAAKWLPANSEIGSDWGRVTRSSALGLIVRIGLFEGTFSKYHNLGNDYKAHLKKSMDAAETMFREGEHKLSDDFLEMFTFAGQGPDNKETVWVRQYGPDKQPTSPEAKHNNSRSMENRVSVTRNMVDLFLYSDGLPREKTPLRIEVETSFDDVFENRDPRLNLTIFRIGEDAYKGAYVPFNNQHGMGYSLKKGWILDEWETTNNETVDKMMIRYAEILLSYAEALYEYNGTITDAQLDQTINSLRARVGFDAKLSNSFVAANGLDMLDEIRRERTVELFDEGFRYNDIIRWKIAEKVLPVDMLGAKFVDSETTKSREEMGNRLTEADGMKNGLKLHDQEDLYIIEFASSRTFDPAKDYLYPIPLLEISLTEGNIVQNPNWK